MATMYQVRVWEAGWVDVGGIRGVGGWVNFWVGGWVGR